jgi:hypothetical protein
MNTRSVRIAVLLALLPLCSTAFAQQHASRAEKEKSASLPGVIWRDPGDISKLDLFYGAGGKRDAPDPQEPFRFLEEDLHGSNPKFEVRDERGREWRVKLGQESRPETAATRLLWAVGYFVDEDYYVPKLNVQGLPRLRRGRKFISADGTVRGARLELLRTDVQKLGDWDWSKNSFEGTRTLNGLRVMMCLIDNWDLKNDNNAIFEAQGERRFAVSDLGASFGKTGNYFTRSKGVPADYSHAKFVAGTDSGEVNLVMHSRPPFFLKLFEPKNFRSRARMENIGKDIPVADAQWIGHLLSELSPQQLRDCFTAAGYSPEDADLYARAVEQRITELNQLSLASRKAETGTLNRGCLSQNEAHCSAE